MDGGITKRRNQYGIAAARWRLFCSLKLRTLIVLVAVFGMVLTASNDTNNTDTTINIATDVSNIFNVVDNSATEDSTGTSNPDDAITTVADTNAFSVNPVFDIGRIITENDTSTNNPDDAITTVAYTNAFSINPVFDIGRIITENDTSTNIPDDAITTVADTNAFSINPVFDIGRIITENDTSTNNPDDTITTVTDTNVFNISPIAEGDTSSSVADSVAVTTVANSNSFSISPIVDIGSTVTDDVTSSTSNPDDAITTLADTNAFSISPVADTDITVPDVIITDVIEIHNLFTGVVSSTTSTVLTETTFTIPDFTDTTNFSPTNTSPVTDSVTITLADSNIASANLTDDHTSPIIDIKDSISTVDTSIPTTSNTNFFPYVGSINNVDSSSTVSYVNNNTTTATPTTLKSVSIGISENDNPTPLVITSSPTIVFPTKVATTVSNTNTNRVGTPARSGIALTECQRMYSSNATPLLNVSWWAGNGEDWAIYNRTTAEGWQLVNLLRLHELATVEEDAEWTVLCVGAVHIVSYSYPNTSTAPTVGFELQTTRDTAIGLVRLRSRCWLDTEHFAVCSPSLIPSSSMMQWPWHHNSPLEEEFWINFTSTAMGVNPSWIRKLHMSTFQGSVSPQWIYNMDIPSLESLSIIGNNWTNPDKILRNLTRLMDLDLSNNNLESLPKEMFNEMPNLEDLILNQNNFSESSSSISRLKNIFLLGMRYSVSNNNPRFGDENIKLFPKSLRTLEMSNSKLEVDLEYILLLPELTFVNVSKNRVAMYSSSNYTSKVSVLDVSENELYLISDNFFSATPALEILILNKNNLYMLPHFPKENNLTHLYASENLNIILTPREFINLRKLQILDLSRCWIQYVFGPIFQNMYALKKVDLSYNLLRFIPDYLFSFLPNLQEVDISHNHITIVNLWKWKFRKLDFSCNDLTVFRSNMSAIEQAILSYNYVQNIDISLSSVQRLNISHNSLSYISPNLWKNISQTLEVDLGGNNFLCCSFKEASYLNDDQDIVIRNLGSLEPIKCFFDTNVSKTLFQTFVYDEHLCRSAAMSITSFVTVITLVVVFVFAIVLAALTRAVLQSRKRKFTLQHSLHAETNNPPV